MTLATRSSTLAEALVAGGPDPEHAEALQLFGRFVGEWDLDWVAYDQDGARERTERGEWIFGWVLEGRGVQDVWIIPARDRRGQPGVPLGEYGTTIRFYDPRLDLWLVTWNGPVNGARRIFAARRSGDDILQEGLTEDGSPLRWVFSEIADDSFTWRSVVSEDGERTWQLHEEMHARRKAA